MTSFFSSTALTSLHQVSDFSQTTSRKINLKLRKQIPSPKEKYKYFSPKGSSSAYLAVLGLLTFHI